MTPQYIAGFFDGEGSAMIITIRREMKSGILYQFRPKIKICQKTMGVLEDIKNYLGFGNIVWNKGTYNYNIEAIKDIERFVKIISPYCKLKKKNLQSLLKLTKIQKKHSNACPYFKKEITAILRVREEIFQRNKLTRSNLHQKYSTKQILRDMTLLRKKDWKVIIKKKALVGGQTHHNRVLKEKQDKNLNILCACGCGKSILKYDNKNRERKYIWGHNKQNKSWSWKNE